MKRQVHLFYLISLVLVCSCSRKSNTEFYLPAEWEQQAGVIVSGDDDAAVFELIDKLSRGNKVYCIVADSAKDRFAKKFEDAGIALHVY